MKLINQTIVAGYLLEIYKQKGKDRFTVIYGAQKTEDLTYTEAANEYGLCLMHGLTCDGLTDNYY